MNVEPWSDLHEGDPVPPVVTGVQYLLRGHGHPVAADGVFGPVTRAAVTAFQGAHGIPASGAVDLPTWLALVRTTRLGSSGEFVRAVQSFQLPRWVDDDPLPVDGMFGTTTEERVRWFQRSALRAARPGRSCRPYARG